MKTKITLMSILCLNVTLLFAQQKTNVDIKNSVINWTGHAEIGSYAPAGTLNIKKGQVSVKNETITDAVLTVDMKSMKQSNTDLLTHLKSEDFFDVEKYPISTIKINRISKGKAFGKLTIKNKTQALTFPVSIKVIDGSTTITGSITIDRTKYGVIYNSTSFFGNLGDHAIRDTFDITFTIVLMP